MKTTHSLRFTKKLTWYIGVAFILLLFLIPIYWMVLTAFRPLDKVLTNPINWIPTFPPRWENFTQGLTYRNFGGYFKNTALVSILATLGNCASAALVGFGFARMWFPGRNVLFVIMLSTMMLPIQSRIIPLFIMFKNIGWADTLATLIVPNFFAGYSVFFVFLMRQFFMTIPGELNDSARIDGCNSFTSFLYIFLPLCKPALISVMLFSFMENWNDFFMPLIFLSSESNKTAALGMAGLANPYMTEWNLIMAVTLVMIAPCIILFLCMQKYFVQGIATSGIKG